MSILKSTNIGRSTFEVDLGLSVNWCAYNVGASKPEEAGLYFAWGDMKGYKASEINKEVFSQEWYNTLPASKINENLKLKDDAANVYMHWKWRTPSIKEWGELIQNTQKNIEYINNARGIRFISRKNKNSIFIPFSIHLANGSLIDYSNKAFFCWSSIPEGKYFAHCIQGDFNAVAKIRIYDRYCGFPVRAVCDK